MLPAVQEQMNAGFRTWTRWKHRLAASLALGLSSCSDVALEDQADRSSVIEFSSVTAEASVVPQQSGLFALKKRIARDGGVLNKEDRLLCLILPDEESGALSMPSDILAQYDSWVQKHNIDSVLVWMNGILDQQGIFWLGTGPDVNASELRGRLRECIDEVDGEWTILRFPYTAGAVR